MIIIKKNRLFTDSRIWILKYIPYVHSSCVRKRIVEKWLSKTLLITIIKSIKKLIKIIIIIIID